MQIQSLRIEGFRGIQQASLVLTNNTLLVGANGAGKSSVIDALCLVLGRTRLVPQLTEHDFFGSSPGPADRIVIVATLTGFPGNDPDQCSTWFRHGRAVEKWWSTAAKSVNPERTQDADLLCAQIGFGARFDEEELTVQQVRYFHDDEAVTDPFLEDSLPTVSARLLADIGFYVLPVRRTWEAAVSFGSELFRSAVAGKGGLPSTAVIQQRDEIRSPGRPLEKEAGLKALVQGINDQLGCLLPESPQFQLRLAVTESDALLRALVPHYEHSAGMTLPVGRHGSGLLSLQTLVLLLEIGRARRDANQSFILAIEEPELHIPPGLQRALVDQAIAVADQTICTSHSPRVAALFKAEEVQVLRKEGGVLHSRALLQETLAQAPNPVRKLYLEHRAKLVEAIMFHRVLIPEGRIDYEWLHHLIHVGDSAPSVRGEDTRNASPPFGAIVGIVPTPDSLCMTFRQVRKIRGGVIALADGDGGGDEHVRALSREAQKPEVAIQWPIDWTIEDVVGLVVSAGGADVLARIEHRLSGRFSGSASDLVAALKVNSNQGGFKSDYLAYEEIAGAMAEEKRCVARARRVLDILCAAALGRGDDHGALVADHDRSTDEMKVYRVADAGLSV